MRPAWRIARKGGGRGGGGEAPQSTPTPVGRVFAAGRGGAAGGARDVGLHAWVLAVASDACAYKHSCWQLQGPFRNGVPVGRAPVCPRVGTAPCTLLGPAPLPCYPTNHTRIAHRPATPPLPSPRRSWQVLAGKLRLILLKGPLGNCVVTGDFDAAKLDETLNAFCAH